MKKITDLFTQVNERLKPTDMFTVELHETPEITTAANTTKESSFVASKSGYYPLGIVGYWIRWVEGQTALINLFQAIFTAQSSGQATVGFALRNTGSSAVKYKVAVAILWMKE